ncbi:hypothetical protein F5Y16DRAFT_362198 [Xylariaceae sp. FL0255]|nr:hypothetical protein F5Y16DRAFT_362198 [Xylariaceae sp. FL0255]
MAILEDVPGIKVEVCTNGRPLTEFQDPHAQDEDADLAACPMTSTYIECINNAEFSVDIKVDNTYEWGYRNHVLVATVYVDGKHVRGSVLREGDASHRRITGREVFSEAYGNWNLRRFKFTTVVTVDDAQKERVDNDMKIAKDLGVIEIKFDRAIEYGAALSGRGAENGPASFELAEKSLKGKAVSHGTSYGAAEFIATPRWVDARNIPEDHGPIAIFKFMYRSREALKRELIIPRSPARSPTLENLTAAQRDALARERLRDIAAWRNNVKSEAAGKSSIIKREHNEVFDLTQEGDNNKPRDVRPAKKSRLDDGRVVDVIDLTDD